MRRRVVRASPGQRAAERLSGRWLRGARGLEPLARSARRLPQDRRGRSDRLQRALGGVEKVAAAAAGGPVVRARGALPGQCLHA